MIDLFCISFWIFARLFYENDFLVSLAATYSNAPFIECLINPSSILDLHNQFNTLKQIYRCLESPTLNDVLFQIMFALFRRKLFEHFKDLACSATCSDCEAFAVV